MNQLLTKQDTLEAPPGGSNKPMTPAEVVLRRQVAGVLKAQLAEVNVLVKAGKGEKASEAVTTEAWAKRVVDATKVAWFTIFRKGGDEALTQIKSFGKATGRVVQYSKKDMARAMGVDVVEKGDVEGHEFHGNQWTGGAENNYEGLQTAQNEKDIAANSEMGRGWFIMPDKVHTLVDVTTDSGEESNSHVGIFQIAKHPEIFGLDKVQIAKVIAGVESGNPEGAGEIRSIWDSVQQQGIVRVRDYSVEDGAERIIGMEYSSQKVGLDTIQNYISSGKIPSDSRAQYSIETEDMYVNTSLANLVASRSYRELESLSKSLKGDVEGHEFHGNQWTQGQGGELMLSRDDFHSLPRRTYIRTSQGEGFVIDYRPDGLVINMSKRARADHPESRDVNATDISAIYSDKDKRWLPVRVQEAKSLKAKTPIRIAVPEWVEDPEVIKALEREMFKFAREIDDTTADALQQELIDGMDAGETIDQLSDRIGGLSDEWVEGWRSEMIARTESVRASTAGHIEAWRSTGAVDRKVWNAAEDACPFCQDMDGAVIDLDGEFFEQGEEQEVEWRGQTLSMSHDYSGINGPPLHPSCRCVLVAELTDEAQAVADGDSGEEGKSLKGDVEGHEFHGNQWTGGGGGSGGETSGKIDAQLQAPTGTPYKGNDGVQKINAAFSWRISPDQVEQITKDRDAAYKEKLQAQDEIAEMQRVYVKEGKTLTDEQFHSMAVQGVRLKAKVEEAHARWVAAIDRLNGGNFTESIAKDLSVKEVASRIPASADLTALKDYNQSSRYNEPYRIADGKLVDNISQYHHQVVDTAIDQWSSSSADTSVRSLEMQAAVAREFGLDESRVTGRLATALDDDNNKTYMENPPGGNLPVKSYILSPDESYARIEALRVVARAMYENTQEKLKGLGVEEVTLWRGSSRADAKEYPVPMGGVPLNGKLVEVRGNAAASWSTSMTVAKIFEGERPGMSVLFQAVVPREAIFSTAVSGLGCLTEKEVVVLGVGGKVRGWRNKG